MTLLDKVKIESLKTTARSVAVLYRNELDKRAIEALVSSDAVLIGVMAIRMGGKVELTLNDVQDLVKAGLVTADNDGFYLSDIVENMIDDILEKVESSEKGNHK